MWIAALRAEQFDRQLAVQDDPAQFIACHPGRRSGKSESIPRGCAEDALEADRGETVILGAETQKKARALHWSAFHGMCVRLGLPFTPRVQEGAFVTPWDSRVVFWGINDNAAVELLRGFKMKAARFDEVATYATKLNYLVGSVLEPALGDTGGRCILYGTPSVTRVGDWADICLGVTPGWSIHHWTVRENPKFPRDAEQMLAQVRLRNNWSEDNPTYQREYMGRFVNDSGMMVYDYHHSRNTAESVPVDLMRGECTLGIDYGTAKDPCAWTAVWSARGSREVYVLESRKRHGLLPEDAALITKELVDRWQPVRIVGDSGGLGAPYVKAFNRRYGDISGQWVQAADKMGVLGQIQICSGELRAGRVKLLPAAGDLAAEMQVLPWKDAKKEVQHPEYANDVCDSFRYAFMCHYTALAAPTVELTPEQLDLQERRARAKRAAAQRVRLV